MRPTKVPLRKPMSILIVEDNVAQVESLSLLLSSMGHNVCRSLNVDSAISVASTHRPDVVILDWVLTRGSGEEFLNWLRSRPETKDASVIISTGLDPDSLPCFDHDPKVRVLPKVYPVGALNDALADIIKGRAS